MIADTTKDILRALEILGGLYETMIDVPEIKTQIEGAISQFLSKMNI